MKKIFFMFGLGCLSLLVVGGLVWKVLYWNHDKQVSQYHGTAQVVRISTVTEYSTLVQVAKRQGFFKDNGIDAVTVEYSSGAPSFKALLDSQVDVAIGSDFVGTTNSFVSQNFKMITSIFDSPRVFEIIARKDRGINTVQDLKGKKIGLTKKTMGEFFLGTFLEFRNISMQDVQLIDSDATLLQKYIDDGTVDAIITFPPNTYAIEKKLGENVIIFPAQDNHLLYSLLYAKNSFLIDHSEAMERFIKALVQAEEFMNNNPDKARIFFKEHFNYSDDYISSIISHFNFRVSLDQALLPTFEDEARWMIENKLTESQVVPNYLEYIDAAPLLKVKPEAVSIIR
jgi:NitT/TauT family transport system substrate-binding protein